MRVYVVEADGVEVARSTDATEAVAECERAKEQQPSARVVLVLNESNAGLWIVVEETGDRQRRLTEPMPYADAIAWLSNREEEWPRPLRLVHVPT